MQLGGFKKSINLPETGGRTTVIPKSNYVANINVCPKCSIVNADETLLSRHFMCACGHHFRLNARRRIEFIADAGTFEEINSSMESKDILEFSGYANKLSYAQSTTNEKEAVITGSGQIGGQQVMLFVMEPNFMMGSMGTVVGEKITCLFELAAQKGLPVIGYTVSGGARMQEGILSLMQMAKVSGAIKRHSDMGLLYIVVLTDPTTGGVAASFAMQGDIILAEPGAMVGFAGPKVIEQTIRGKLPDTFQKAEFLLSHGFIDKIIPRDMQKTQISTLLRLQRRSK